MAGFIFNTTPQLVSRPGASGELGQVVGAAFGTHVMFVTDPGIRSVGLETRALASLEHAGIAYTIFDAVEADPSLETVKEAAAVAREAMKQTRLLVNNPRDVSEADALAIYSASW